MSLSSAVFSAPTTMLSNTSPVCLSGATSQNPASLFSNLAATWNVALSTLSTL